MKLVNKMAKIRVLEMSANSLISTPAGPAACTHFCVQLRARTSLHNLNKIERDSSIYLSPVTEILTKIDMEG